MTTFLSSLHSTAPAPRGYPNCCRRIHFFAESGLGFVDERLFTRALSDGTVAKALQDAYLGFIVVRPIPGAPLGRTVLRWFDDDRKETTPRVTTPSRPYSVCVAGLCLSVRGLAWQEQDQAVGACATIALWSVLHSSGFDGFHALPTTTSVTRAANRGFSSGGRLFPSRGLNARQMCEAITAHGLSPVLIPGDDIAGDGKARFDKESFSFTCSALIRSGFPVILAAETVDANGVPEEDHAVCVVGFRSTSPLHVPSGEIIHHDHDMPCHASTSTTTTWDRASASVSVWEPTM